MAEIKEMKTVLGRLIAQLEQVVPYADALYIENNSRALSKDKTGIEARTDADAGVKIRAFDGYQYHELCIQGWQPALLQQEVQQLAARLKNRPPQAGKSVNLKIEREQLDKEFSTTSRIDPNTVPIAEKAQLITQLQEKILSHSKDFVNCRVTYREEDERRVFVNRHRKLASKWTGCTIVLVPFVQTPDGQTRYDYYSTFANGFEVKDIPEEDIKHLVERALKVKAAGRIPPGKYASILSPNVSGLLAHESFGHGMESDTILKGRAKAEEFLGKKLGSVKVNICEDGSLPNTHGFIFFDDEGIIPHRVYLVKSGVVTEPITESYSAAKKGYTRSANGRAESFNHKAYARMTNTFFLQGKDDLRNMLKEVKNGMFLHHGSSGMEDPKGWGVQIAGVLCERIKNGKLTGEYYYEASISGYLPTILANITAVSKDFEIKKDAGFCGKGHKEWVRVSSGGPYISVKELDLS